MEVKNESGAEDVVHGLKKNEIKNINLNKTTYKMTYIIYS
jgi:hypothetical protein